MQLLSTQANLTTEQIEALGFSVSTDTVLLEGPQTINGAKLFTSDVTVAAGTAALPKLNFAGATTTGLYLSAGNVCVAIAGVNSLTITSTGFSTGSAVFVDDGASISFRGNSTTKHVYYGNQHTSSGSREVYIQQAGLNRLTLGSNSRGSFGPGNQSPTTSYSMHLNGANDGYGVLLVTATATSPGDHIHCRNSALTAEFRVHSGGGVTQGIRSGSADATATEFPASTGGWWKNTTANEIRFWYNDGGTMKKSAALT
jgi:hypothetical protein